MRSRVAALSLLVVTIAGCGPFSGNNRPSSSQRATNGEENKTATAVLADARNAFLTAGSVHVAGRRVDHGVTYRVDGQLVRTGGRLTETSTYGEAQFVTKSAVYYLNVPSAAYSTGGRPIRGNLQGRWLQRSADAHDARISIGDFFRNLQLTDDHLRPQLTVEPGAAPTVTIRGRNGDTLTVAGFGTPLPLVYMRPGGTSYRFDRYGEPVTVTAPADAVRLSCGSVDCDVLPVLPN